jgi:uncharacterized protein DUF3485
MRRLILVISGSLVMVAAGVVHGVWTDRWDDKEDLVAAAAQLPSIPMELGEWHGSAVEMKKEDAIGLAGLLARSYVHRSTGRSVTLLIGCGRAGPVSIHTPEICYAGSGYEVERPRMIPVPDGEFWTARLLKQKADERTQLRIFWAWSAHGKWQAPENPRLAFAGQPLLYKLYIQRELVSADDPLEGDPCVEFMRTLLPELERTLWGKQRMANRL